MYLPETIEDLNKGSMISASEPEAMHSPIDRKLRDMTI